MYSLLLFNPFVLSISCIVPSVSQASTSLSVLTISRSLMKNVRSWQDRAVDTNLIIPWQRMWRKLCCRAVRNTHHLVDVHRHTLFSNDWTKIKAFQLIKNNFFQHFPLVSLLQPLSKCLLWVWRPAVGRLPAFSWTHNNSTKEDNTWASREWKSPRKVEQNNVLLSNSLWSNHFICSYLWWKVSSWRSNG